MGVDISYYKPQTALQDISNVVPCKSSILLALTQSAHSALRRTLAWRVSPLVCAHK